MSTREAQNKDLVRSFVEEIFNKSNLAVLDQFVTADIADHKPPFPGLPPGIEGSRQVFAAFHAAFPDARVTIEDMVAEGDRIVWRWTFSGTNQGSLMGMPPTGKPVTFTGIDIFRMADGKIVERWANEDDLGMMQQLGMAPPPG
ncbi:MAG: ester cyclase [Chloroflexi bacterium]|nr:ester cyclase [Chloroflexota bacterium]